MVMTTPHNTQFGIFSVTLSKWKVEIWYTNLFLTTSGLVEALALHSVLLCPDPAQGEQQSRDVEMANIHGEQSLVQKAKNTEQFPPISELVNVEKNALVIHASENKSSKEINSEQNISENKDLDDEHPTKKLKFLTAIPVIPCPTPLNSINPEHLLKPLKNNMIVEQFNDQLLNTTSSNYSPTPPREPTPP
ncbi:hypothetical protein Tco_0475224 [Tanacetum coccineum]